MITIGRKKKALNTTYIGVRKRGLKSFSASITIANERRHLGTFDTAKEAARAFDNAAIQAGRPKTLLNFPESNASRKGRTKKELIRINKKKLFKKKNNRKKLPKKTSKKNKKLFPPGRNGGSYRGVRKSDSGKKFCAQIHIGGTMQGLGTFDTAEEAARAYDRAQKDISKLNFSSSLLIGDDADAVVPVVLGKKGENGENGENGEKEEKEEKEEAANVKDEESYSRDDVHSMLFSGDGDEEGDEEEAAAAAAAAATAAAAAAVAIKMKEENVREQVRVVAKVVEKVVEENFSPFSTRQVKYIGVKKTNFQKFEARISMEKNTSTLLGTYDTDREAAHAYDMAAKKIGLPVSKLNFHQVSYVKIFFFENFLIISFNMLLYLYLVLYFFFLIVSVLSSYSSILWCLWFVVSHETSSWCCSKTR